MNSKNTQPLLIIGTQRSGSNLLRLMLNQLPEIVALHPPHILQTFFPLIPLYGDLSRDDTYRNLVDDVCSFVELNPSKWEGVELDRDWIIRFSGKRSLVSVYRLIYETVARTYGKRIWCCKSMANVHYIPEIEQGGLRPFYLHLYRDGRDAALSFKKAIVGEKHIYAIAEQWAEEQRKAIEFTRTLAPERTISVRYEELLSSPETELKKICADLETEYSPDALKYHESSEAKSVASAGEMWANVVKPVLSDNKEKFRSQMSEDELYIFESVAGDQLQKLGYALVTKGDRSFSKDEIKAFSEENKKLKGEARARTSKDDLAKREPQEKLVESIRLRLGKPSAGVFVSAAGNV